jgi:hypothetical protein
VSEVENFTCNHSKNFLHPKRKREKKTKVTPNTNNGGGKCHQFNIVCISNNMKQIGIRKIDKRWEKFSHFRLCKNCRQKNEKRKFSQKIVKDAHKAIFKDDTKWVRREGSLLDR